MYREMEEAGLPEPEYKMVAFMVHATIKNKKYLLDESSQNTDKKTGLTPVFICIIEHSKLFRCNVFALLKAFYKMTAIRKTCQLAYVA